MIANLHVPLLRDIRLELRGPDEGHLEVSGGPLFVGGAPHLASVKLHEFALFRIPPSTLVLGDACEHMSLGIFSMQTLERLAIVRCKAITRRLPEPTAEIFLPHLTYLGLRDCAGDFPSGQFLQSLKAPSLKMLALRSCRRLEPFYQIHSPAPKFPRLQGLLLEGIEREYGDIRRLLPSGHLFMLISPRPAAMVIRLLNDIDSILPPSPMFWRGLSYTVAHVCQCRDCGNNSLRTP